MQTDAQPALVRSIVNRYARRNPWIDAEDLRQEAWVAMLQIEERGTWLPGGAPLVCYQAQAVLFRLRALVLRGRHQFDVAPLATDADAADSSCPFALAEFYEPAALLDNARAVTEIIRVLGSAGAGARAVLLDGAKPAEAARSLGLLAADVYYQTDLAKKRLRRNPILQALAD